MRDARGPLGDPAPGGPRRRSSPGGDIVTDSLAAVGYRQPPSVALVETAMPRRRAFEVVVSQNAWNLIPAEEFLRLSHGYRPGRKTRYAARRVVAALNNRRTPTPVVLSDYMAGLLSRRGLEPVVAPVTLPLDLCVDTPPATRAPEGMTKEPFVLVPGTLTPYKNADYAVDLVGRLPSGKRPLLVLAGTDDGSGQRQRLLASLRATGLRYWAGAVSRGEMAWLLTHAVATVVPSLLESLSFSVAEALALSRHVLASPLPVHREVAARLGREPLWLPPAPDTATAQSLLALVSSEPTVERSRYLEEWHELSRILQTRAHEA